MEFYLFILSILFLTAIADLAVGVANDAVNFLNSAVGSRAASRRTILIVASLGVLVGTTFSSGIMEVARKGIFNPEYFVLHEVMIIFLAVMLTDIILLDLFNTFSLPTSTTISIIFEIFGGAMAIAVINVLKVNGSFPEILSHINTINILIIISGIILSIIFAFIFGFLIQFITRFIFTFDYEKTFRRFGALYCAAALSAITYFIVVKGARGSSLISPEGAQWLNNHLPLVFTLSFITWGITWQLLISFTKINILRITVLIGTFALALAFASNDLVNFVGAPLGALSAFQIFSGQPGSNPLTFSMEGLSKPVQVNTLLLLMAGTIMVITLWISRKASSVTKTEVYLGRQEEGIERFGASPLSRAIVRIGISVVDVTRKIIPVSWQETVTNRIDPKKYQNRITVDGEVAAFDLLRATVNLMVASALISFGTALKLPLSTTFVTFMVAMSTSLADKSWGRESAAYRVNGVITVIAGWFFTAFLAFTACFVFTIFIYHVKLIAILILMGLTVFSFIHTARVFKKREIKLEHQERELRADIMAFEPFLRNLTEIGKFLEEVRETTEKCLGGLIQNRRKDLKKSKIQARKIAQDCEKIITSMMKYLKRTTDQEMGSSSRYAQKIKSLESIASQVESLTQTCFQHIDNNHHIPDKAQATDLKFINELSSTILSRSVHILKHQNFIEAITCTETHNNLQSKLQEIYKKYMKHAREGKYSIRQSLLVVNTLSKLETISQHSINLVNLYRKSAEEIQFPSKNTSPDIPI